MKILVVGSGGREHAFIWTLQRSSSAHTLYAAPGNPGIAQHAECVPIGAEDIDALVAFVSEHHIDLTVVGPEVPLSEGLVDRLTASGMYAFGPSRAAAAIETSKVFAKRLMLEEGIPTAEYQSFTDADKARAYVRRRGAPIVVKADGLAAGKGAVVCYHIDEAFKAIEDMMIGDMFGAAGQCVVIEEYMEGEEASVFAITDGTTVLPMISSQDHKQIYEGDQGPNTGGMGAYAPAPIVGEANLNEIMTRIIEPTIQGMAARDIPYRGVLYAGVMMTDGGPKVVEFNCRYGDPEAQVLIPLLENDLAEVSLAVCTGTLKSITLDWRPLSAICVVLASGGYPGSYDKGKPISGLEQLASMEDVIPFHAGTAIQDGQLVTSGGRVLGITAFAPDLPSAIARAYEAVDQVTFEACYYRRDIGQKALKHL